MTPCAALVAGDGVRSRRDPGELTGVDGDPVPDVTRVPALLSALVDDAGLFPPEQLPMDRALARHRADAEDAHPVLTHRFLCASGRLADLRSELADEVLRLGLIVDAGPAGAHAAVAAARAEPRLRLETVEVALPAADVAGAARTHVPALATIDARVFVELPRGPGWRDGLDTVAAAGIGAKVRCGGIDVALFPSAAELAAMVTALVEAGVPWKATAGLHHAVRYRDARTGFDHHGFLNLLVAVGRAVRGGSESDVAAALMTAAGRELATEVRAAGEEVGARTRRSLVAYGSCSTRAPVADLDALGLLDDGSA